MKKYPSSFNWKRKDESCIFFKEGKCTKGADCPFLHDIRNISICKSFLKGDCKEKNCSFSHNIDRDKLPFCHYFILGNCNNEACLYPHVKVNQNSPICTDFLKGSCPRVLECKFLHSFKKIK